MRYWCIVPAAGSGARMQQSTPKAYLPLLDKTVIEYTLQRLLAVSCIEKIMVVVPDGIPPGFVQPPKIETVIGGQERCHSVLNGLQALVGRADQQDWVLVHDVARPCVSLQDIQTLIGRCEHHPVGGLLARPIVDTVKRSHADGSVAETLDRKQLWCALTPQCFRFGLLLTALQHAVTQNYLVTDESHAIELLGHQPLLVEGLSENIKITYPKDLKRAEFILREQL